MPANNYLKSLSNLLGDQQYQPYPGRYLVFAFMEYYPDGGQGDVIESVNTLAEVELMFQFDTDQEADHPFRQVDETGKQINHFDFLDVLDMQERRFIDINDLHFYDNKSR